MRAGDAAGAGHDQAVQAGQEPRKRPKQALTLARHCASQRASGRPNTTACLCPRRGQPLASRSPSPCRRRRRASEENVSVTGAALGLTRPSSAAHRRWSRARLFRLNGVPPVRPAIPGGAGEMSMADSIGGRVHFGLIGLPQSSPTSRRQKKTIRKQARVAAAAEEYSSHRQVCFSCTPSRQRQPSGWLVAMLLVGGYTFSYCQFTTRVGRRKSFSGAVGGAVASVRRSFSSAA